MRYFLLSYTVLLFGVGGIPPSAHADTLDSGMLDRIANSVFEVVVQKPEKDSLTYDGPLPLQLFPYSVRTDKYYPIGSAFAISPSEFVSASHVLNLASESQFKKVYLRGKDGAVYNIEKIVKYSERRDLVVFSLKDKMAEQFLEVNLKARINEKVLAVGNALGEGTIIRDGLYTSDTPEDEDGEWKWLRFSAAASPGNSGGPLLDKDGKVIGLIIGRSPNENLNYALPMAEVVNASTRTAIAHRIMKYTLANMDVGSVGKFTRETPLPKSYSQLKNELTDAMSLYSYVTVKSFFTENRGFMFPNDKGSDLALHSTYDTVFPNLLAKSADGRWYPSRPQEIRELALANNGRLSYGNIGDTVMLYIQKGENISLQEFSSDGRIFMDTILQGLYLTRQVGSGQRRITSLGKPGDANGFTDSYGRRWQVRSYPLEYSDQKVLTFSLAVPGGSVTLMRTGQTGVVDRGHVEDLKILTNFIYLTYYGTLKQWREFLGMKELLPSAFSSLEVQYDYDNFFRYKSKRLSLSFAPDGMKISDNSYLKLFFSFFKDNGRTVWDVARILIGADVNSETRFRVVRNPKPPAALDESSQGKWENITGERFPFNKSAYYEGKATVIEAVVDKRNIGVGTVLYTAGYIRDGKVEQKEMEGTLEGFLKGVEITETAPGGDTAYDAGTDSYHDSGDYYRALWERPERGSPDPQSADGYILRGTVREDRGDFDRAVEDFTKALELEPGYLKPYLARGRVYSTRKDNERALADYGKVIDLNPTDVDVYLCRGNIYKNMGQYDKALDEYNKAIELNPKAVEPYTMRGSCFSLKKDWGRALADFDKAIEMNPKFAIAYYYRGIAYKDRDDRSGRSEFAFSKEDDVRRALSDLSRAIEINPRLGDAYAQRGVVNGRSGQSDLAIDDFSRALELDSTNAVLYNNRGFAYRSKGELDRAIEDFNRSIDLNNKDALAFINRGNTYALKKDMDKACYDWKQACIISDCGNYLRGQNAGYCR